MSKLKLAYIASLGALAVILVFTVSRPLVSEGKYSEVQRESLIKREEGWIAQFDLVNHEGNEQNYTLVTLVGDVKPYTEKVRLESGQTFTFVESIQPWELGGETGKVTFEIYKAGLDAPFEEITYYLKQEN